MARRSASPTANSPNPCRAILTISHTLCHLRQPPRQPGFPQGPPASSRRYRAAALALPDPRDAQQPPSLAAPLRSQPRGTRCRRPQGLRAGGGRRPSPVPRGGPRRTGRLRTRGGRARLRPSARQHRGQRPAPRGSARPRRRRRCGAVPPARHGTARPGARRAMATEVGAGGAAGAPRRRHPRAGLRRSSPARGVRSPALPGSGTDGARSEWGVLLREDSVGRGSVGTAVWGREGSVGAERPVRGLKGCEVQGGCRLPLVKAGAGLGWAVGLAVLLPDAVGRTRDGLRRFVGHGAGSSPMLARGSAGTGLGTTWHLHPLLQPPKLPHRLQLGGWHGLSHPVGSQGLASAAGAAGPFHEDTPLQPAHTLGHCCSPSVQSLLLLASLPSSCWELLGWLCSGALLGTGVCPLRGPWPAGNTHSCVQEPLGVRPDASPGQVHVHSPSFLWSRGLPQHPPLASILPSLPASHLQCQAVLMA